MNDLYFRMLELTQQGFQCSQILILLGLEVLGRENPDLVRAMDGLNGGIGFCGKTCGALTGGACLLGLFAGKGRPEDPDDPRLKIMLYELLEWFETATAAYGGIDCMEILQENPANRKDRCPQLVQGVFEKVRDLLVENGYEF
ncbi:MAG TPA: C-GCAxxG-C-C family protein [Patescibacteria group bacterium]|nr:C-GCAxxG-C-C family protein [Patescibacteria group bacterium]